MPIDWNQPLPREQLRPFLARSDLAGWRMLAFNWGLIIDHMKAGTADAPDLPNYQQYPVSRASLRRKLLRDLG